MSRSTSHLTAELLRADESPWGAPGSWRPPRADHVVLDEHDGTVALLAYQALGGGRIACERALLASAAAPSGPDASEDLRYLQAMAAHAGIAFARPGSAPSGALHRRAFAAPGSAVCGLGHSVAGAGAYGMLAWSVGALECATALAGHALPFARPPVIGVRLDGAPPVGVSGLDVLVAVLDALGPLARGAVLECHGDGIASIEMDDRVAFAAHVPRGGARAAVFPADDRTRATLRAQGRDEDWRRFEGGSRGFDHEVSLDLAVVRPRALPIVERVIIGSEAEDDAVRRVRFGLERADRSLLGVLEWVPGGRIQRDLLRADGTLAALEALGVLVHDVGAHVQPRGAAWLGSDAASIADSVSPAGAVAFALGHARVDPVLEWMAAPRLERGTPLASDTFVPPAEAGSEPLPGERHRIPSPTRGHRERSRGVAVSRVADGAGVSWVPKGPRTHAVRAEGGALAEWVLREQDPGAAARAMAHGGGFVLAGTAMSGDEVDALSARALAALGVNIVLADRIAAAPARQLALHGVLPLTWEHRLQAPLIQVGDELEVTNRSGDLESGARVSVRDLTRGVTLAARAELDAPLVAIARQGGWLATCTAARERERGGRTE